MNVKRTRRTKIIMQGLDAQNESISSIDNKNTAVDSGVMDNNSISKNLSENLSFLKSSLNNSFDIIFYEFNPSQNTKALIVYVEGMVARESLSRDVINPLVQLGKQRDLDNLSDADGEIKNLLYVSNSRNTSTFDNIIEEILDGNTALFIDGLNEAFIVFLKGHKERNVDLPDIEVSVKGPREAFIEDIIINTSLLRRKIKNKDLVLENIVIGRQTHTKVVIAYIAGIVNTAVLDELKIRLGKIDTDSLLDSGQIEQYIQDKPFSIFQTIGSTQRPDTVAAKILEGRVAVFCDGSPHVLTVPYLFIENFHISDDYYNSPLTTSILRILRIMALLISVLLPAIYVSLQNFHHEMIPTQLLISMTGERQGAPLPAIFEAMLMIFMFELLKESGVRLPKPVGSAITIVGALVIGDAAVNAGLISALMVIVIAVTALSSFVVAKVNGAITIYRFIFLFLSGFMGLFSVACGIFITIISVVSLSSFGVPFTSSIAPMDKGTLQDYFIRFPLWANKKRPSSIVKNNVKRREN